MIGSKRARSPNARSRLSEQLRHYLDDQAWLENRRIMQLVRDIEQKALRVRGEVPDAAFMEIDEAAPAIGLPMDRTLYNPPFKARIVQQAIDTSPADIPADALFEQIYVDQLRLASNIRRALQSRTQVSLGALLAEYPLEQGLAELATYLKLATSDLTCAIDDDRDEVVQWVDAHGQHRQASVPLVIYTQ